MLWLASLSLALAAPEVVVVPSPGLSVEAVAPWITALRDAGVTPRVVGWPCSGSMDDLRGVLRQALERSDPDAELVVLAEGVGATLALAVAAEAPADRYVLVGPVLDVVPVAATRWVAEQAVGAAVDLDVAVPWTDHDDLRAVLLGEPIPPLGCVAPSLATEVQGWIRTGTVPLDLVGVRAPTWIGLGLLDDLAPPEAVVPASRRLPDRTLVRLGLTRLDPTDYDHAGLLRETAPVRAAVRAVLHGGAP
jgi:hypothetical protein